MNSKAFKIVDDTKSYNKAIERKLNYYPERLPFNDCLYLEVSDKLKIEQIVTFDKHFKNKGIEIIKTCYKILKYKEFNMYDNSKK